MVKKILGILVIFIMCTVIYPDEPSFLIRNMDISLTANIEDKKINVYISVKSKLAENCYIPYDYLNFYCISKGSVTMQNDWLLIFDDKKNEVPYFGLISDRFIQRDFRDYYFLAKNQEYIISLKDIESNYYIPDDVEWITIRYLGPLGESNTVKVQIK